MVIAGAACLRSGPDGRMDPARIAEVKKRCGIRRADRYTAMMVAAALEAVKDAGFEGGAAGGYGGDGGKFSRTASDDGGVPE